MTSPLVFGNHVIVCFLGQSPTFDQLFVNFPKQNEFDKNNGVYCHFYDNLAISSQKTMKLGKGILWVEIFTN